MSCLVKIEQGVDKAKADIRIMEQALELYRLDMFSYPTKQEGLKALMKNPPTIDFQIDIAKAAT